MKQFHDREVVRPLSPHEITDEVRKKALVYLMFLKAKFTGEIKARGCADGRPQRVYKTKQELSPQWQQLNIYLSQAQWLQKRREMSQP